MHCMQHVNRRGEQILLLVPERALLKPWAAALKGKNLTAVTLDGSSPPPQLQSVWENVSRGDAVVVVGTQKTLMLPWARLGLIVIDAEHYATHKLWDQYPRLDNRLAARTLASIHHSPVIVSGSIPSLDLRQQIATNKVAVLANRPLTLRARSVHPTFADRHERGLLPAEAVSLVQQWLKHRERIFILHNRLGAWSVLFCRGCSKPIRCAVCDTAMAVRGPRDKRCLVCRQCGQTQGLPNRCPACQSANLKLYGLGMETIAGELTKLIPRVSVMSLDAASLRTLSAEKISERLAGRAKTLLLGTTAAFRVLLDVGIERAMWLFPELMLLRPDVTSTERTVSTVARLQELLPARRSVVLVTRLAEFVQENIGGTLDQIYARELDLRRRHGYPPFNDMVRLTFTARQPVLALKRAAAARNHIARLAVATHQVTIYGPYESQVRRGKKAEAHLLLLGSLNKLTDLYRTTDADVVDVRPDRVL